MIKYHQPIIIIDKNSASSLKKKRFINLFDKNKAIHEVRKVICEVLQGPSPFGYERFWGRFPVDRQFAGLRGLH